MAETYADEVARWLQQEPGRQAKKEWEGMVVAKTEHLLDACRDSNDPNVRAEIAELDAAKAILGYLTTGEMR